jgi:hypothetical protein
MEQKKCPLNPKNECAECEWSFQKDEGLYPHKVSCVMLEIHRSLEDLMGIIRTTLPKS